MGKLLLGFVLWDKLVNVWYSKCLLNISHTASVSINNQIYKKGDCVDVVVVVDVDIVVIVSGQKKEDEEEGGFVK